jgi:hypothetical protein
MRLTRVEIEGYRSVAEKVDLHIDRDVTVLLGANDHGKTNILSALLHLNPQHAFDESTDLNWDRSEKPSEFPAIAFQFDLDIEDREIFLRLINQELTANHEAAQSPAAQPAPKTATSVASPAAPTKSSAAVAAAPEVTAPPREESTEGLAMGPADEEPQPAPQMRLQDIPEKIRVERRGVRGELKIFGGAITDTVFEEFAANGGLPRVEMIRPQQSIPDSVGVDEVDSESHEFMRGIFYYAGLNPGDTASLVVQNDTTMMALKQASAKLNQTLKADWTQGKDLRYELGHESKAGQILLRLEDPAVSSRLVRASHRSSGFTHFFALKTVLYARERDNPANSYIFLFDEPGIYLHPSGQYDLLQVLDAIGKYNQVIYSTHSLFMINKTFPIRHRLIVKTDAGTRIDGKPFIGRWGPAIQELGFSLAGTILFAQYVLLAEGDADPMLIEALFQKLVEWGKASIDLNAFSVISTGDSRNTDALIRILKEGVNSPKLLVLVDGDTGGTERLKRLKPVLDAHRVPFIQLDEHTTIEDYLPGAGAHYPEATGRYVGRLIETLGEGPTPADVLAKMKEAIEADKFSATKPTSGIADWAIKRGRQFGKLKSPPSKVGIAREYLDDFIGTEQRAFAEPQLKRALALLRQVQAKLSIPELRDPERRVTTD